MTWAGGDNAEVLFLTDQAHTRPGTTRFTLRFAHYLYLDGFRTGLINLGPATPRPNWFVPPYASFDEPDAVHALLGFAGRRIVVADTPHMACQAVADSIRAERDDTPASTAYFFCDGLSHDVLGHLRIARLYYRLLVCEQTLTRCRARAEAVGRAVGSRPWSADTPVEDGFFEAHDLRSDAVTVLHLSDPSRASAEAQLTAGFRELARERAEIRFASMGYGQSANVPRALCEHTQLSWLDDNTAVRREALGQAACLVSVLADDAVPLDALQALAVGCPVVAVAEAPVNAQLVDGVNCITVPPNDAGALSAAIQRVVSDDALRASLVARGKQTVLKNTWRGFLDALPDELLAERRADAALNIDAIKWDV